MTDLRTAARQALWAFQCHVEQTWPIDRSSEAIFNLRAAMAQQADPVAAERERIASQWDGCFTHQLDTFGPVDIGASIRAGEPVEAQEQAEPPTNQCGETCERAKLCAACARALEEPTGKQDLQVEPAQEPVAVVGTQVDVWRGCDGRWAPPGEPIKTALMLKDIPVGTMLYTAPPQRKPLTDEEIHDRFHAARNAKLGASLDNSKHRLSVVEIARAIERAHGIKE